MPWQNQWATDSPILFVRCEIICNTRFVLIAHTPLPVAGGSVRLRKRHHTKIPSHDFPSLASCHPVLQPHLNPSGVSIHSWAQSFSPVKHSYFPENQNKGYLWLASDRGWIPKGLICWVCNIKSRICSIKARCKINTGDGQTECSAVVRSDLFYTSVGWVSSRKR